MDRLSTLLTLFGVRADLFYSGGFCGVSSFDGANRRGHIHLLQEGELGLAIAGRPLLLLTEPSLIFFPRPSQHQLVGTESGGARLQCASLEFAGGANNPLAASLPDLIVQPLSELPMLSDTVKWLFAEAAGDHCGRHATLDRLFELTVIQLLRHLLDHQQLKTGMMAGLSDVRLARSLVRIHEEPHYPWSISELAGESNMSRASYAAHFKDVVGQTPAEYLLSWRISLAQKLLREGRPMALISEQVGYESPSALARAFRRRTGLNPRDWMKSVRANGASLNEGARR
ncbi:MULTISPECIES: AraC family transcriptional regulator [unclassified Pseudomonas]|uniref:AraC family transcriptional regulator n=1 Tax=Aquipseudomonas alcaligenes TaxID=43263 RepID=A0A5C7WB82_AQUAC|nr:AraC family transcriptional regulator [Pseudomonas sp. HTZ1]MDS9592389.1 AraC family transcriptional regulator [Pseudomonas sp. HTZ1]TXI34022.1 MAG: AraC family transcriptional regulator [Pseudomonas alcaligenes]HBO6811531.1 AraC family transcriptional regulator [Pseudomonas aeruginosa]